MLSEWNFRKICSALNVSIKCFLNVVCRAKSNRRIKKGQWVLKGIKSIGNSKTGKPEKIQCQLNNTINITVVFYLPNIVFFIVLKS